MPSLLTKLQAKFPDLKFVAGTQFVWSPESGEIVYAEAARGPQASWALLHETGHALLEHNNYSDDFHLVELEILAWDRARELAAELDQTIDEGHIQDCLDTYREWLFKRSLCPACATTYLQQADGSHYRCHNCHTAWRVSTSRFCRAYRSTTNLELPEAKAAPVAEQHLQPR
jgi:hypothetical protein